MKRETQVIKTLLPIRKITTYITFSKFYQRKMEVVQVISQEFIKPSTPTPNHPRRYQLSFLDQLAPPCFLPMVFFFLKQPNVTRETLLQRIKKSLSETLTLFYPLAGRIVDNDDKLYISCNDAGAYFVEAEFKSSNSQDILESPNPNDMNKFLAVEIADDRVKELPVGIQVTFFDCGGISIGLCINHKVADGLSYFMFLQSWSALSRGESSTTIMKTAPLFGAAKLFPPRNLSGFTASTVMKDNDTIVTKRFVFDSETITKLRTKYEDKTSVEHRRRPTRFEALSAFLWRRLVVSTKPKGKADSRNCTMLQAVNLRTRMNPPIEANYFGNITRFAISSPSFEAQNGSYDIVSKARESLKQISPEFVKKLQASSDEEHLSYLKKRLEKYRKGEVFNFSFTSLCGVPIYEIGD